jgi:L-ascorbate metabolism protein UlaG (beta-lactamase superfamily)
MPSRWSRCRDLIAELVHLPQSLAGGPGYHGPVSDHFDGRHFFNRGASAGRPLADLLRWQRTRQATPWPRWRENQRTPVLPAKLAADEMAVTLINHVTFLIQLPGLNVLTDPVYCERASPVQWAGPRRVHAPGVPFERLPPIDVVFVSHNHYDHMDLAALRRLAKVHAPLFLTGLGNGTFLRQQGITPVVELDWWEQTSVHGAQLIYTPAQHWSTRGPGRKNHTLWGGLWLASARHQLYFAADTGYCPWFAELRRRFGPPSLALLPIGAYEPRWFMRDQHMNPDDSVRAHLDLGARTSVAMHFGCFRLTDEGIDEPALALARACSAHGVSPEAFHVPQPGETLLLRAVTGTAANTATSVRES